MNSWVLPPTPPDRATLAREMRRSAMMLLHAGQRTFLASGRPLIEGNMSRDIRQAGVELARLSMMMLGTAGSLAARAEQLDPRPVVEDASAPPEADTEQSLSTRTWQIVGKLREADVLHSQGMAMADAIRQLGVSEVTYYRWRHEYGGLSGDRLHRLKESAK